MGKPSRALDHVRDRATDLLGDAGAPWTLMGARYREAPPVEIGRELMA
jgi:hypothetical protein